jgi:hypothetical protein
MVETFAQDRGMRRALSLLGMFAAAIQLTSCVQHPQIALAPATTQERASFSVAQTTGSGTDCEFTLHLDGTAYSRANELEIALSRASVAITRVNNKQMDVLLLQVSVGGRPATGNRMVVMRGQTPRVVLGPTVDSAGPQLTTWQSDDTLRLVMPWRQPINPAWLYLALRYTTVSYTGEIKRCSGSAHSDSLRFVAGPS